MALRLMYGILPLRTFCFALLCFALLCCVVLCCATFPHSTYTSVDLEVVCCMTVWEMEGRAAELRMNYKTLKDS